MSHEIAVVGLAGRFPGAADVDEFWSNILAGKVALSRFTREELLAAGVPEAEADDPAYVPAGGVIRDHELFDSGFFGIPPREADIMDPQHRLLLQTAWQTLESGGLITDRAPGRIGVFAGSGFNYYLHQQVLPAADVMSEHGLLSVVLGNEKDHLATKIAYRLGLGGPAITVQTACSTSLVAVHLACQSLRSGDTDVALAGGSYLDLPQRTGYLYEPKGIMSPDGMCRPFDASANGTVSAGGVGMVALKRLEDALRDGDVVHAVIEGSAINNDGAGKVGYTAPGVEGQIDVLARAYRSAGVDPSTVGYLEAHGTATEVGDAIELAALNAVFGEGAGGCSLGSVKANIGHLSTAAGVAGLIKTVLALEARRIPPLAGLTEPRKELLDPSSPFTVDAVARDWTTEEGRPRRAAVSSFGLGGTNVHVVLREAPESEVRPTIQGPDVVLVSARTEEQLREAAERLAAHLRERPEADLADVALTTQRFRRHFPHRLAVTAKDAAVAAEMLPNAPARTALRRPTPVFLFPGQGAEAPGMSAWAYERYPSFAADIDEGCEYLGGVLGFDLRELLIGEDPQGLLHRTDITQPALVLHEYALGRLLTESWGVRPAALIGHSVGEFAAAGLAGELEPADMLRLVAERGALMQSSPEGAMIVVLAGESVVRDRLEGFDGLDIASVNAPEVVVVSGPAESAAGLRERLTADRIMFRMLPAQRAFHSWMMSEAADSLDAVAKSVAAKPNSIDVISSVTGEVLPKGGARPEGYWARQLRSPVRFQDAVRTAMLRSQVVFVEVGPGTGLIGSVRQIPEAKKSVMVPVQARRGELLSGAGALWSSGVGLDWAAVRAESTAARVVLPTYPFARTRHWLDTPARAVGSSLAPAGDEQQAASGSSASPETSKPVSGASSASPARTESVVDEIIALWRSLLGAPVVEADSDFFVLGGESLLFIRMVSKVRRRFGVSLDFAEFSDRPTPAAIADRVSAG